MIDEIDVDRFRRLADLPGNLDIRCAGSGIAGWMIVHANDRAGVGEDRRPENFAWVGQRRRRGPERNQHPGDRIILPVEHDGPERLLRWILLEDILHVLVHQLRPVELRSAYLEHGGLIGNRGFVDSHGIVAKRVVNRESGMDLIGSARLGEALPYADKSRSCGTPRPCAGSAAPTRGKWRHWTAGGDAQRTTLTRVKLDVQRTGSC